ncbi:hypothetical protein ACO2Q0_02850 [Phenylobacterium sp. VNQ135]|uniref:hypothetical protein n=1 Tax=Phenylobacterium sp. VNQ135 TaxID=3400922 RepID=UPI003C129A3C
MADFQLDTSGAVGPYTLDAATPGFVAPNGVRTCFLTWDELTPFQQGYVRAALADAPAVGPAADLRFPRFSDLSPATLEAMLGDCERRRGRVTGERVGALFWKNRQGGHEVDEGFPPLTLFLADDGLIHHREAGR